MKGIGINIILAQAGLYVPCQSMELSPYTKLFTRITGNDNIFRAQSSFTLEMMELRTILSNADEQSLVIGDEVCRGTETLSANAIVSAMLCFLAQKQTSFIFATHLHGLNKLPEIQNLTNLATYHLAVGMDNDTPIYSRIMTPGSGDSFYGLMIARQIIKDHVFLSNAEKISKRFSGMDLNSMNPKNTSSRQILEPGNTNLDAISLVPPVNSRYNSAKYMVDCSRCGTRHNLDTHHKIHQSESSNSKGIAEQPHLGIHSKWNLESLCKACHRWTHVREDLEDKQGRKPILNRWVSENGMKDSEIENFLKTEYDLKLSATTIRRIVKQS